MSQYNNKPPVYIHHAGPSLLEIPLLNKGSAFTPQERLDFNLIGLLPHNVETIEEQVERAYAQYRCCRTDLDRHIFLRAIQDDNETLFFSLLEGHLEEILPVVYTPTVGEACQEFSRIYRNHRGIFVAYPDREHIQDIFRSATKDKVKIIVVTDGERILGLGDQGIGGMGIPIGKLSLYTACGGISPAYTLPITLDSGTNNETLLNDPMYMGWRHRRISETEYDVFIAEFMTELQHRWPGALVQFEDFAQHNAMRLLDRYRHQLCAFNDDIQGTAAVTLGTILAACNLWRQSFTEQRITFVGAGSAGCGIAECIIAAMVEEGLSEKDARSRVYMVDRDGLLVSGMSGLHDFQAALAQDPAQFSDCDPSSLADVIRQSESTILIGVSGQRGLFTREVIETLHANCPQPLVMPLSNPSSQVEATPAEILTWTQGLALVATGSPFSDVTLNSKTYAIPQCNNAYIFPGVGLGVVAAGATRVTDKMLVTAARTLARQTTTTYKSENALLPPLGNIQEVSRAIAFDVGRQAQREGVAPMTDVDTLERAIGRNFWHPRYRHYRRRAI